LARRPNKTPERMSAACVICSLDVGSGAHSVRGCVKLPRSAYWADDLLPLLYRTFSRARHVRRTSCSAPISCS
jgi:hypothetical protein